MKILLLDNYDSFTYNLYHYLEQLAPVVDVKRNDEISVEEAKEYSHIVISPGPGLPKDAGITNQLIKTYSHSKVILGICLGCQAIAEVFGGELFNQNEVTHGVEKNIVQTQETSQLFKSLPYKFKVGLYHSWAIQAKSLPSTFKVTAQTEKGIVMAIEHQSLPISGVQFHPESIMSENGLTILKNGLFL